MNTISAGTTEVEVKLTTSGRYVWSINSVMRSEEVKEGLNDIASINRRLKDLFPDHAKVGSGRTIELE
jgi:hypothetical protein